MVDLPHYLEPFDAPLRDGWTAHVRQIAPADRAAIEKGYEGVSPRSRRLRYLAGHPVLSEAELDAITRSDGVGGFAIGAELTSSDNISEPAGAARYVRDTARPNEAELAITIADRFHNLGLGSLLLGTLAEQAVLSGIDCWRAHVARQNTVAIAMFSAMGGQRETQGDPLTAASLTFLIPLHVDPGDYPQTPIGERMREAYGRATFTARDRP